MSAGVLVLNASYEPLNICAVKRAVRLVFSGKAEILHDRGVLSSPTFEMPLPSVIRMLYYVFRKQKRVPLTKKNVLLRDNYKCGYCEKTIPYATATVDHIVPKRQNGKSTWLNLVAACSACNSRKRDRTPKEAAMALLRKPHEPRYIPFVIVRKHTQLDEWRKYLDLYSVSIEEKVQ